MALIESPLAGIHRALGAKFAEFSGWEMPLEYAGVLAEHRAVRESAGIFDVSHLGTVLVEGPGAVAYLNTRLSNDLNRIVPGHAQYTLLLNDDGGVVDDMIVYVFSPDRAMVIPNAANSDEVIRRLTTSAPARGARTGDSRDESPRLTPRRNPPGRESGIETIQYPDSRPGEVRDAVGDQGSSDVRESHSPASSDAASSDAVARDTVTPGTVNTGTETPDALTWTDRHQADAIIAVQGPLSPDVLAGAGLPSDMDYMSFRTAELELNGHTVTMTVCRTGYTGEHGYEIVVNNVAAPAVWETLMSQPGVQPCGLGARDTLRTEMGYPLHGSDLSPTISPVEARLSWAVGWKKPVFDGCEAVRSQRANGVKRTLLGLIATGRGIPRHGMTVLDAQGTPIGEVTSGTFSPTLKKGIALALLPSGIKAGDHVQVEIRGRREPFDVVKPPFVPSHVTD